MEDWKLLEEYAVRKLNFIEVETQEKAIRQFPYITEVKYKVTKLLNVYVNDNDVLCENLFKISFNKGTNLQNLRKMVEGICDSLDIQGYTQYNFVSDNGFEILDSKEDIRRFIYELIQIKDRGEFYFKVSEILRHEKNDVIKPLKCMLGVTKDDHNYVEPFMKTLALNDIKIQKGKFYDER